MYVIMLLRHQTGFKTLLFRICRLKLCLKYSRYITLEQGQDSSHGIYFSNFHDAFSLRTMRRMFMAGIMRNWGAMSVLRLCSFIHRSMFRKYLLCAERSVGTVGTAVNTTRTNFRYLILWVCHEIYKI